MSRKAPGTTGYFTGIVVLVHLVYFIMACCFTRIYMGDSFEYIWEAINIKEHGYFYSGNPWLPFQAEYLTQRQPLYPMLLAAVYYFTINNWVVIVLQNALSVFNILYCRKVFGAVSGGGKFDKWLLLLTIAYPAQFINANTIAPDVLLQTFTLLYFGSGWALLAGNAGIWPTVNSQKQKSNSGTAGKAGLWQLLLMSCWLCCGLMVKPVLYPFAVLHLVFACWVIIRHKLVGRTGFAVALLPVAAVAFYNYGNLQRTGKFHFSSNQAFNAIYYYYPFIAATSGNDSAGRFLTAERAKTAAITNYAERYNYANGRGMALLQQNFGRYMLFHIRHTARILIEPGKAEMDLFTGRLTYGRLFNKNEKGFFRMIQTEGPGGLPAYAGRNPSLFLALIVLLFNCVRLAGIYFFIRSSKLPGRLVLFPLAIIAYFAFAAGPIANTRYFLPVSLISIGCAAVGWATRKQTRS